jgi:hypothetical protein
MRRIPRPSRSTLLLACLALAIGVVGPSVDVAWKCRAGFETREACVWGKSLLPLSLAVSIFLVTPITFGILCLGRAAWRTFGSSRPSA